MREADPRPCRFAVDDGFEASFHFTPDNIREFAALSGDNNPLHHDEARARESRFGGLIACAGQPTSWMMGALATFLTAEGDALGLEFSFRLLKAVKAGETLMLTWTVLSVTPKATLGGYVLEFAGTVTREDGGVSIVATAKGLVMSPVEGGPALQLKD